MTEEELKEREREHQKDLERLRRFRPMDDAFMRCLFRDNMPLAQFVLRIITGKEDLTLVREETQKDLKRLVGARSVCLDVHGVDNEGRQYDLEVQRDDDGAVPERARYHASAIDIESLDKRQKFVELPGTYIIFITEDDRYGYGRGVYRIERAVLGTECLFGDRQHIIYVNGQYRGDDMLGDLMHDFCCSEPDEMKISLMAESSRYWKEHPKGVEEMCKILEDMRRETAEKVCLEKIRIVMRKLKYTAQQAMEFLEIPDSEQKRYLAKL